MWVGFAAAVLVCLFELYVPGYFALRLARLPRLLSVSCAPVVGIVLYCALGIVYAAMEVASSFALVVLVPTAVLAALAALSFLVRRKGKKPSLPLLEGWDTRRNVAACSLYVVVGLIVGGIVFVWALDGPASPTQTLDNPHHYSLMRSFADSGCWSILEDSLYLAEGYQPPLSSGGFYPAGWHVLGAATLDCVGASVGLVSNALNYVCACVVFPLSFGALMLALFRGKEAQVVFFGAFVCVAIVAFSWELLIAWPLFPNLLAFEVLPIVLLLFIEFFEGKGRARRAVVGVAWVCAVAAMACAQPNAVFCAYVFLAPYCVWLVWDRSKALPACASRRWLRLVLCGALVVCMALAWYALFKLPLMQGVVTYYWPARADMAESIVRALSLQYLSYTPQVVAAILVVVGAGYLIAFERRRAWLVASYALALVIFVVSASMGDVFVKHLLSGFWYTDPFRVAAFAALFALPLLAMGLYAVSRFVAWAITAAMRREPALAAWRVASGAIVALFVMFTYAPTAVFGANGVDTAFASIVNHAERSNSTKNTSLPYNGEESQFVDEALDVIPDGALVINLPFDGSVFAYGLNDINVYYRYVSNYATAKETEESVTIREGLSDIASNASVWEACASIGAEYVLLLDQGANNLEDSDFVDYDPQEWTGITSITDATPGFELVSAEGDMRLYRIVGME